MWNPTTGALVRNYIPCLDTNDTPCLYDLVEQKPYYNAGNYIINDCEIANNIKVKCVKNGDIILYKEFHLPKDALKGIILNIGDNATYEKTKSHLEIYLEQLGYEFDIRQSKNGPKINV